jgi:UDP-N-acetyl-D-glucosamine dehydrogenase
MKAGVPPPIAELNTRIGDRTAAVGVCGMGYVGLPLAVAAARAGYAVIGFDIDAAKTRALNEANSYIEAVSTDVLKNLRSAGRFRASCDFAELAVCDVIVICVPTPLTRHREPDLSFVEATVRMIAATLRPGQLIVLESTTYPGTTDEVVRPIFERTGLKSGSDFLLGYSPEREDPGNKNFTTASTAKIAAGDGERAQEAVCRFYGAFITEVVPVSTNKTAEAVKLTENVFRAVNIALVNELKVIFAAMGIDIWEVIDAAKTKPFGYMPFYPGPGLGGHCIPIDPFYLTWKAREFSLSTRFIELAGEINLAMPEYVVNKLALALDQRHALPLNGAHILIIGLAYKKNVPDTRESPSLRLIELLEQRRAAVDFHDPLVPLIPPTREHRSLAGRRSVALQGGSIARYDAVLVATDHDKVDYGLIARHARLIIDTRNVFARLGLGADNVIKA